MRVRVRLFAILRERAGTSEVELELPAGARAGDALAALSGLTGEIPVRLAVNRELAPPGQPLAAGDEIALIPPVSGGADEVLARIRATPLAPAELVSWVSDPRAGAIVSFLGVTREVGRLDYEAYEEMALAALREVAGEALARHGLCRAAVEHRTGSVPLGEPSVAVAVSAPHRPEAFAGAREIIDELKARAPIWKREVEGGTGRWVAGEPPR